MEKPTRLFTDPKAISRYLYCVICDDVFDDPARLPCGHTFCRGCISKWTEKTKQCPSCRAKFTAAKISRDLTAANIIGELSVMCPYRGCLWKGELENVESHQAGCCFHPSKVETWLIDSLPPKIYNDEDGVSIEGGTLMSSLYEKYGASALSGAKSEKALAIPKALFLEDLSDTDC